MAIQGLAPEEVYQAWGDLPHMRQVAPQEWHSACPKCGEMGHNPNSGAPNRFYVITELGNPERTRGRCRVCGYFDFAMNAIRQKGAAPKLSPQELLHLQVSKEAEAKRRQAEMEQARERFIGSGIWRNLNQNLGPTERAWWRDNGVPDDWQDYWSLGHIRDYVYHDSESKEHHCGPAYSIPYLRLDKIGDYIPITMQYRLASPGTWAKYLFTPLLGTAAFIARPDLPIAGETVVVVEGAKKAMVTYVHGVDAKYQVVGFPSVNSDGGIIEELKQAGRVFIILDPDSWRRPDVAAEDKWIPYPVKFAREIGPQAKCLRLPHKIDDAILHYGMTAANLEQMFRYARSYSLAET